MKLAEVKRWGAINEREAVGRNENTEREWLDLQVSSVTNKESQSLQ